MRRRKLETPRFIPRDEVVGLLDEALAVLTRASRWLPQRTSPCTLSTPAVAYLWKRIDRVLYHGPFPVKGRKGRRSRPIKGRP